MGEGPTGGLALATAKEFAAEKRQKFAEPPIETMPSGKSEVGTASPVLIDSVPEDGIRQYRISLAREARLYRQNQPKFTVDRERQVVLVISTVKGLLLPQVTISQSSDDVVLDHHAREVIEAAVKRVSVPALLNGREFGLTLSIQFAPDDAM